MDFALSRRIAARLDIVAHTGSTNADLRDRAAAESVPHLSVLLTRDQRSGRGRLDRSWQTPPGAALAVSVLLRLDGIAPAERGWVPLVAGLAMSEAISAQLPDRRVSLKWPNDVLVEAGGAAAKICGILAEAVGADEVIVGTGINTAMTAEQAPVPTATSFAMLGVACDEDRLLADYLTALERALSLLREAEGAGSGIHTAVSARCSTLGQQVRVILPSAQITGRARRLAPDGRLVVDDGVHEHIISAGDIVHLRPE